MGIFLNRGNEEFDSVVHSQIYIDKTEKRSENKEHVCKIERKEVK